MNPGKNSAATGNNDGWFRGETAGMPLNPDAYQIRDLPAIYHNNSTTFTSVDGLHQWKDPRTLTMTNVPNSRQPILSPNNDDLLWLMQH